MPTHRHQPQNSVTQSRLKKLLNYSQETGVFTWAVSRGTAKKSSVAGYLHNASGYKLIKIDHKLYRAARLAFLYIKGYWPEYEIDHINRIKNDDRWINLRHVSRSCNAKNSNVLITNTSGITGICVHPRGGWTARIDRGGKRIHLGCFKNFYDAVVTRRNAEIKYGYDSCNSETSAARYLKNRSRS